MGEEEEEEACYHVNLLTTLHIGPIGHPGMPEAGVIPIPRKLKGISDMLRLSDGRMSGTAGGTIVLHISPESALIDSPLGIVQEGDIIRLSLEKRLLEMDVSDQIISERIEERRKKTLLEAGGGGGKMLQGKKMVKPQRGYRGLYEKSVNQAEEGADFDFLTARGVA